MCTQTCLANVHDGNGVCFCSEVTYLNICTPFSDENTETDNGVVMDSDFSVPDEVLIKQRAG